MIEDKNETSTSRSPTTATLHFDLPEAEGDLLRAVQANSLAIALWALNESLHQRRKTLIDFENDNSKELNLLNSISDEFLGILERYDVSDAVFSLV